MQFCYDFPSILNYIKKIVRCLICCDILILLKHGIFTFSFYFEYNIYCIIVTDFNNEFIIIECLLIDPYPETLF